MRALELSPPVVSGTVAPAAEACAERGACVHCGLPVGEARARRGSRFCCEGCARVHALIVGGGLDRYYDLQSGAGAPPAELQPGSLAWLDAELDALRAHEGACSLVLDLQGIHCAACVWLVRELFLRRAGAIEIRINPALGQADITWDPGTLDLRAFLLEVESFGYRFGPRRKGATGRSSGLLVRLGVSAAAAMNIMIFSFCFYAGLAPEQGTLYTLFGRMNLALTALAVIVGGGVFFRAAWRGVRARVVHLDLPIAVGIALAFAASVYAYAESGPRAAYFDTVAIFITLMLTGRFLQERVLERNRNALLASSGIDDLVARRIRAEALESVPVAALAAGDELLVVAGDVVPVAATLRSRAADLALDWITGESEVREFTEGARVPAGAFNAGRAPIRLAALEAFADSNLQDLLATPRADADARLAGAAGRWWRRLATSYVAAVLALAALGVLVWLPHGVGPAFTVAVAILVVTCPCALGLAVPLAHELTHVALRRCGVFLRDATFFDRCLHVRKVVFDKTGTLTSGRLELRPESQAALAALTVDARDTLAAMASRSNHPASRALARVLGKASKWASDSSASRPAGPRDTEDPEIEEHAGSGIELRAAGAVFRLGRPAFASPKAASAGGDETWFARDGVVLARLSFTEEIRGDAPAEVATLAGSGYEIYLLSGDVTEKVRAVADVLRLDRARCEGRLSPDEKAARVRALDREDTLMVGDGINDAPSFAAAFCTATPAVDRPSLPARADFYFLGEGIAAVRRALAAGSALRRVIRANLAFALGYNALALALCFAGMVTPLVAAVLMPASSLLVVGHTIFRLSGRRLAWTS